mgnify:CR=1 FL=1
MRAPVNKWSLKEHLLFIEGLAKLGRGDWKGIARHFVKTRTSTQVASHAQKHFARLEKRKKKELRLRASIFDDAVNVDGDGESPPATNSATSVSPETTGTEVCSGVSYLQHFLYNIIFYQEMMSSSYLHRHFFTPMRPVPIRHWANHDAWARDLLR